MEALLKFGEENSNTKDYFPEYEYQKLANIQWLCDILNTLLRNKFADFVKEKIRDKVKHTVRKRV